MALVPRGAHPGVGGRGAGQDLIQELLRMPPAEVADWALGQVQSLTRGDVKVEETPLFQLAGVLNSAPLDQKQALVRSAMTGFSDLPATRKAEVMRLAMSTQNLVQQAEGLALQQRMDQEYGRIMGGAGGEAAAPSSSSAPPLIENFLKIAQEAKFNEMPKEELTAMTQEAQANAVQIMQPQQLVDVVAELEPEEREKLTAVLVEAKVVPEEQRGVLEEAVRPGGYADKLSSALRLADAAVAYAWVFVALPLAEFAMALVLGLVSCGVPLLAWLRFDAVVALLVAGMAYFTASTMAPVLDQLRKDPVGAVQRWQTAPEEADWRVRLEMSVPGVPMETYRNGAIGLAGALAFVLVGAVWAVIGALELLVTMALGCDSLVLVLCVLFIGLRLGCLVAVVLGAFWCMDEVQRHRSRAPMLGSTLLPMQEDALGYTPGPGP